ncbi:DUF2341 domain-containing protein [Pelagerythrobacter marensis]|uniref:MotA/TolQ/ExbB proton channel n=2 Tax=Pelagerythrobacter marensis TaxID=543877 RepID=A0A0G3X499_9SPHN|nr:DUF2341 domain-containing protein [Pelagerythrobacter marensis]AKM06370.1 MotA/TolQ/ExbB proton channel [Pelagerythrobacter marensis]
MKKLLISMAALAALVPGTAAAQEWWDSDWGERRSISVSAGDVVGGAVGNAPVLVRLHAGNFDFSQVAADGSDLRFVTADGTPLDAHLESFNRQAEVALAWVELPSVGAAQQQIYVYYGNADAPAVGTPADTYDGEQSLVVHFAEGSAPRDATANNNAIADFVGELVPEGLVAGGARLTGSSRMQIAPSQSLTIAAGGEASVSAWVRPAEQQVGEAAIFTKYGAQGPAGAERLSIGLRGNAPYVQVIDGSGAVREAAADATLAPGEWAHLAVSAGDGVVTLYVGGQQAAQVAADLPALGGMALVGANGQLPSFAGDLDELWQANTARSADFVAFAAASQGRDATVVQTSGEAQEAGDAAGGHNYLSVLFGALTVDAWIVIVILLVMLAIAIAVMVSKAGLLSRVERANAAFREAFRNASGEAGLHDGLVGSDRLQWAPASTLGQLFSVGREETRQRLDEGRRSARDQFALAPQSVAAIRAAMDAQMAREGQKLNARMVLLTIAISGGPFLGLLGTVIGVMITFAGVAAAGEVNINAIAPGIAAALLATVAGLAVAIPALFGYNWLLSRVEKVEIDNQVFVDELEKRLAETYRPSAAAQAAG